MCILNVPNISKIRKVPLRELWEREDKNFTVWLSNNIESLNDVLGHDVSVESIEERVGPYRVDIYAEDKAGSRVIIENQLEKTDHTHLGQLLTYMINLGARGAIWITSFPTEEHQKVIEWLNETTPDDTYFYLVKVEGIRIEGADLLAPLFTVIASPTLERKQIGAAKKETARSHGVRERFWSQFLAAAQNISNRYANINPSTDAWIGTAMGFAGVGINLVVTKKYARVEVYINRGDQIENQEIFDRLENRRDTIEKAFGEALIWERKENKVTSRIKYELEGVSVFDEDDWQKMTDFLLDGAERLHKAMETPLKEVRSELGL